MAVLSTNEMERHTNANNGDIVKPGQGQQLIVEETHVRYVRLTSSPARGFEVLTDDSIHEDTNENNSLLTNLPAELRNQIYVYALVGAGGPKTNKKRAILVGDRNGEDYSQWMIPRPKGELKPAWREPGLLQASKQVREEGLSVYYGINNFHIVIGSWTVVKAMEWVRKVFDVCGTRIFDRVHISMQIARTPGGVAVMFPIAKLIFEIAPFGDDATAEIKLWIRLFSFPNMWNEYARMFKELVVAAVEQKGYKLRYHIFQALFRDWTCDKNMVSGWVRGRERVQKEVDEAMGWEGPTFFS